MASSLKKINQDWLAKSVGIVKQLHVEKSYQCHSNLEQEEVCKGRISEFSYIIDGRMNEKDLLHLHTRTDFVPVISGSVM